MQEEDLEGERGGQGKKPGFSLKKVVIFGGILLVLLGAAFLTYTTLFQKADKQGEEHQAAEGEAEKPVLISLKDFVVNLTDAGRFMKVTIEVEIKDVKYQPTVEEALPKLRDAVIILLSSKSYESILGPEGKFQLKDEILVRLNQTLGKDLIKNLYFTEFVVQ
ncbi:Flagellar basal body-associated protein FliL [Candidatus Magnetoovum chiemensis]|nr:Flagellar basal body-associated protein FliL [Candidatus Magnetoovum chiemensis]